jgi:hypothetical protein
MPKKPCGMLSIQNACFKGDTLQSVMNYCNKETNSVTLVVFRNKKEHINYLCCGKSISSKVRKEGRRHKLKEEKYL